MDSNGTIIKEIANEHVRTVLTKDVQLFIYLQVLYLRQA